MPSSVFNTAFEVARAPRGERPRSRLADAVMREMLDASLDYEATLTRLARAAVPQIADWCVVDVLDGRSIRRLAVAHEDSSKERWAWELHERYPPRIDMPSGVARVLRTGESEFAETIPVDMLRSAGYEPEHVALLETLGMVSGMSVPLRARGRTLGAVTFISTRRERRYTAQDVAEVEEVLAGAGMIVDNARLHTELRRADEELRRSRDQLRAILDGVADGITLHDAEGRLHYVNDAAARALGVRKSDGPLAVTHEDVVAPFDVRDEDGTEVPLEDMPSRRVLRGEQRPEQLVRYRRRGTTDADRWSIVKARPLLDERGEVQFTINIFTDVTALKQAAQHRSALAGMQARAQAEAKFRGIVESAPDAIVGVDESGLITVVNSLAERMFGYERDELLGRPLETLLPERFRSHHEAHRRHCIAEPHVRPMGANLDDLAGRRKDGSEFPAEISLSPICTDEGLLLISIIRDVTERKRSEERITHLAYHDRLTGLPNRSMLERHLGLTLARARRTGESVALVYIDLDEFKAVNDSLGHSAGDELLRQVAQRLSLLTRTSDLLARQGGDEFLLVAADLDGTSRDGVGGAAVGVASRVHEALREPFTVEGAEFRLGASVGISLYPTDATDADTLLRHADAALYEGKARGRGTTVLFDGRDASRGDRLSLITRLRRAVEREEFVLHYQPVVDLDYGGLVGVEALVRWEDPDRGLVMPRDFIPTAESLGLIDQIGDWVAAEACRQAAEWEAAGASPFISLNLSAHQLRRPSFARSLLARVREHGIPPSRFMLELTESAAMHESEPGAEMLEALAAAGFRLAVDDFGTGYSSLSRLRDLPTTVLKIDRSFVAGIEDDARAAGMVRAVVEMARTLGSEAVAEGIETLGQWRMLREMGCRLGQGHLFQRPAPAADLAPVLGVVLPRA